MGSEAVRHYIAIDLKSFYASVECVERCLDPLGVNLVVADKSRTEKTICLAVSPALKAYGIPGRARLYEVIQKVKEINDRRKACILGDFTGTSYDDRELRANPTLRLDFIIAQPQMGRYMEVSNRVFEIYLKYIAPEDIHVYSVDEAFMDVTDYLKMYNMTPKELAMTMIRDVLKETGITATAGVGTNLYLCKIAMDIVAKHMPPDENGVRIAELDEMSYRRELWNHRPLTDFWRIGKGIASKLEANEIYTMGDICLASVADKNKNKNEDLLYKLFGINAELIIDHAWGWEPCRISDIKSYRPRSNSLSVGQVLSRPYTFEKARIVIKEMTDSLVLDLVSKGLVTNQMILTIGYDTGNLLDPTVGDYYDGPVTLDHYGRAVPKYSHSSINLDGYTSSTKEIISKVCELYDSLANPSLTVRRMSIAAASVIPESEAARIKASMPVQISLFTDYEEQEAEARRKEEALSREHSLQKALIDVKGKYGKNAVLKGLNYEQGATGRERNGQIGGHRA